LAVPERFIQITESGLLSALVFEVLSELSPSIRGNPLLVFEIGSENISARGFSRLTSSLDTSRCLATSFVLVARLTLFGCFGLAASLIIIA
jgi:hypothetical protein